MDPKYIEVVYNTSDVGYMDEEWKDYNPIKGEEKNIVDDEEQVEEIQ